MSKHHFFEKNMLLKEDGRLDIDRVNQLTESELKEESATWGNNQWFDYLVSQGTVTVDEAVEYFHTTLLKKIVERDRRNFKQTNFTEPK